MYFRLNALNARGGTIQPALPIIVRQWMKNVIYIFSYCAAQFIQDYYVQQKTKTAFSILTPQYCLL